MSYYAYYVDGEGAKVMHGSQLSFHDNLTIASQAVYVEGRLEGTAYAWYSDGTLKAMDEWKNGVRNGGSRLWNEQGDITLESSYSRGELDGVRRTYKNRWLECEQNYEAGKRVGREVFYWPESNIARQVTIFSAPETPERETWYRKDGSRQKEVTHRGKERTYKEYEYWDDGETLSRVQSVANGMLHGEYREYDKHGQPIVQGTFEKDEKVGEWIEQGSEGRVTHENYEDGIILWRRVYEKGLLVKHEVWSGDNEHVISLYDEGVLRSRRHYKDGVIASEEQYENGKRK